MVGLLAGLVTGCRPTDSNPPGYTYAETWGGPGTESGQFREPIGLAIAGTDEVFVGEGGGRRIQVFSRGGEVRRQIDPVLGNGDTLRRPMHIAVSDSALYVPDFNTDQMHVLSHQGAPLRTLDASGLASGFDAPGGVGVAENGQVYVSDFYNHRVLRFHENGTLDRQWGMADSAGTAPGRFTYPTDIAPLPDGGFVVADFYNHRIQEFTPEGKFVQAVGEKGTGDGQFERPVDVAVGPDGGLYVVDLGNERIQVFASGS